MGGVSERPTREAGRSDPLVRSSSRRWKASGSPGAGTLRGGPEERGSWSVRTSFIEVSSSVSGRADDSGCSLDAEEGNDVGSPPKKREHPAQVPKAPRTRGRVLRSVQRPVHVDRHYTSPGKPAEGGANGETSRSGKLTQVRGTGTEVSKFGRMCGSPCVTALAREKRDASEKEEGRGLRPCEEKRAPVALPVRRSSCRNR